MSREQGKTQTSPSRGSLVPERYRGEADRGVAPSAPRELTSGRTARTEVTYSKGPSRRLERPSAAEPVLRPSPSSSTRRTPSTRPAPADGKSAKPSEESWRTLRRTAPDRAKEYQASTRAAGRLRDAAVGATVGAVGGVYASPYRGTGSQSHPTQQPWGFDGNDDGGFSFAISFGFGSWCSWWWWPCYWSWYYPCWWSWYGPYYSWPYSRSYYPSYYPVYYPVYPEYSTEVAYPSETAQVAPQEPVGEASSYDSAPLAQSSLSIAAQRYLELGDRAFREGRYTDAVQFYAKAVEFAPDQGALYLVLADALFAAGDYHYGAYAIRRALELDATLVESNVDKHGFYPQPAIFDQHLAALERYLAEHSTDRDARLVLALNYLFGGRAADAVRTIEAAGSALDEDPAAQKILVSARNLSR